MQRSSGTTPEALHDADDRAMTIGAALFTIAVAVGPPPGY
jgi:hypothetical protein